MSISSQISQTLLRLTCGVALLCGGLVPQMAQAVECRICERLDARELEEFTVTHPSKAMRHQVRAWLAENYPETTWGMNARAWLIGEDDPQSKEVEALYRAVLAQDPQNDFARNALAYYLDDLGRSDEGADVLAPIVGRSWRAMYNHYFMRRSASGSEVAQDLLATWEREGTETRWVPLALRARLRIEARDWAGADALYLKALESSETVNPYLLRFWLNNQRMLDREQGTDRTARLGTFKRAMAFAARADTPMAFEYVAEYAREMLRDNVAAYRARAEGIKDIALPELVSGAFFDIVNRRPEYAYDALEDGLREFPYNYDIAITELEAYSLFRVDPQRADAVIERMKSSLSSEFTVEEVGGFILLHQARYGRFDESPATMAALLPRVHGSHRRALMSTYLENRIAAADLDTAESVVDEMEGLNTSQGYIAQKRDLIAYYRGLIEDRDQWYETQPFLRDWEKRFGDSLRASVEFETAKSDIREVSWPVIQQAAEALKAPGGENYVFQIEGHTDSRGSDAVNFPLSEARASAVKAFMVDRLGIDAANIQTRGFGPDNPIAPNTTEAGRQANRRVEIRPLGNFTDPQIATPGAYNIGRIDVSRDGRTAVMGSSPTQVWDLARNVVLHEVSAGLNHSISPNGRFLASVSTFTRPGEGISYNFYIYDLRSGKLVDILMNDAEFGYFTWSPFSDRILITDFKGLMRIYDMSERKVTDVLRLNEVRAAGPVVWLNSGEAFAAKAGQTSGGITVFDARTLKPKKHIPEDGWLHSFGQTHDGRYVIGSFNDYGYKIWDTEQDWREVGAGRLPLVGRTIRSHPTRPQVLLTAIFDTEVRALVMDLEKDQIVATTKQIAEGGGYSPEGDRFITGAGSQMIELDSQTLEIVRLRDSTSPLGAGVALIEGRGLVVTADAEGTSVWSLKTGRRVHRFDATPRLPWRQSDLHPGQLIGAVGKAVVVLDSDDFTVRTLWSSDNEISNLLLDGDTLVVATVPPNSDNRGAPDPQAQLHVFDVKTLREKRSFSVPIVNGPLNYGGKAFNYRVGMALKRGKVAVRTDYSDGFGREVMRGDILRIFDVANGRELNKTTRSGEIKGFYFDDDAGSVMVRTGLSYDIVDVETGKTTGSEPYDPTYAITLEDGRKLRWFWDRVTLGDKTLTFPMSLTYLVASEKNHMLVGQTRTGTVHFIDLDNLAIVLTISSFRDGQWLAYTPGGNYTASLNGTRGVYWSLGDNYLPFDALAAQFDKPNLVQALLNKLTTGQLTDEDIVKPEVEPESFDAPYTLHLVSPASSSTKEDSFVVQLKVDKDNADLPEPKIRYQLNGREVVRSRGFEEDAFFDGTETVTISRRFSLREGLNHIEASLIWKGTAVATEKMVVERKSDIRVRPEDRKNLWFFGVGVSDYADPSQNLEFADKDARALAALLEERGERLFDKVHTRVVTNAEATERNVRVQMNEFLSQAAPDDVVIVFVAGHGVTDNDQSVYFMTHDAELSKPYTGMNVDRFRGFLENRPLNQSALLLLDICHSGAAGRVISDDAVQKLTEGTGAIVFASSSGAQLAYEDASYGGGHGAFTAALLEALRGMADQDTGNRDGLNSLQEMVIYTSSEVPRLTQGRQRPTIPMMAQGIDYPISVAGN